MSKKHKKKRQLENIALITSIISALVSMVCLVYETFFK